MTASRDWTESGSDNSTAAIDRRQLLLLSAFGLITGAPALGAEPKGELTWGVHVSLAPSWFDPAEATGMITPFMILYALHDAMVKPMPGKNLAPSLAESWSVGEDGRSYDFVLRDGARFHNGDPVTAEDVKFTFERYRGTSHELMRQRVAAVEIQDPRHIRFRLAEPWPDFLTFYATTTGAGWIVPKKHIEKVGGDAFKKAPVGAGPYKFVSFKPGLELVLEAFDGYWRKTPAVKRLTLRVIPDEATRLAALKGGEIDIVYSVRGELARELDRLPGLTLKSAVIQANFCVYFADQWDPKSPWHDVRVRRAANLAIDREGSNAALMLGRALVSGNPIVPSHYDFYWQPPPPVYDPQQAKKLLGEAGFPNGFDGGEYYCDASYASLGETVVDNLLAVGLRTRLRPIERAAFIRGLSEKKFRNLIEIGPAAFGNAATRIAAHVVKKGIFAYGSYPDIDDLYRKQAVELDRGKREAMLHKIQQMMIDRAMFAPVWQLAFINGVGPRVGESGFGRIAGFPYTAPYEDLTLNAD
ncbi:MAG: ABC transporter substrate-binding protein [Alphaproteobacteria bacterium]